MNRREQGEIGDDEIVFWPADDSRECGGCTGSADGVVSRLRSSS
jgi:hypothetical protein